MITICIPIYNFNVSPLIRELSRQAKSVAVPYQIVIIDDYSFEEFKKNNKAVCEKETYIQLDKNIGRAKIRNLFLTYSTFDNLLFLDCDSLIISDNFISTYIDIIKQESYQVVCGGRVYAKNKPDRNKMLRWKYGIEKESQPANIRNRFSNKSLMTNNFMIRKKILEQIHFDERITGYGHEDTLFGYQLKKAGITVKHINNSVLNGDIEDNKEYLIKTENAVKNLIPILSYVNNDTDFINDVTLLRFYNKVVSTKLTTPFHICFICLKPIVKYLLSRGYINLWMFDFYKLGIFIENKRRFNKNP